MFPGCRTVLAVETLPRGTEFLDACGYSGGSTDRPDLQRLLDDIRARKLDVIVVYKVDRLTRALADFAKLVELFDAQGGSFVSVTQQFNTTTSMGRLTLNVLLSFAQFERENLRTDPGQDCRLKTEGSLGRRSPAPWLCDEGRQDCRRRRRSRTGPADLPAVPRTRRRQCPGARPQR